MHPPHRIVSLLPSATEILFALGVGDRVVAVSHECDFPSEAAARPRATRSLVDSSQGSREIDDEVKRRIAGSQSLYELDVPLLGRMEPDLIVTQAQCDVCAVRLDDVLELVRSEAAFSQTEVLALNPSSLADVLKDIRQIGQATGAVAAAEQYAGALQSRIDAVHRKTARIAESERPRVVCIEWIDPLMTAGNWVPELITIAGGIAALTEPGRHSGYVSWDDVRSCDPDVVIVAPCGFDLARTQSEARSLTRLSGWNTLSAVAHGRCYALDGNAWLNRSGPRLVESLEILAHLIHPERFAAPRLSDTRKPAYARLSLSAD